jgi:hypothetical protein
MIEYDSLIPYLLTNAIALALVFLAFKHHRLTRLIFILIFLLAGLFNIYTSLTQPEFFNHYADKAFLNIYKSFINGYFSQHIQEVVATIGLGQIIVALLLSAGGRWLHLGVIGGIIFFIALIPLGVSAAFPAMLLFIVALALMQYRIK